MYSKSDKNKRKGKLWFNIPYYKYKCIGKNNKYKQTKFTPLTNKVFICQLTRII